MSVFFVSSTPRSNGPKKSRPWRAQGFIRSVRKKVFIGNFETYEEALAAEKEWFDKRGGKRCSNLAWLEEQQAKRFEGEQAS